MNLMNPSLPRQIRTLAILLAAGVLAAGCNFAPKYRTPAVQTPAVFK